MARIRTVKPELWTDPEFVECSLSARLLFIALWNFATDHGVIHNKPRQIQMQCLPADGIPVGGLIEELVAARFIIPCRAPNGDDVLFIRTFAKNQRINRPTHGRWGDPAKWPEPPETQRYSLSTHGGLTEGRDNSDNSDNSDRAADSVSTPCGKPVDSFGALLNEQRHQSDPNGHTLTRDQRHAILKANRK